MMHGVLLLTYRPGTPATGDGAHHKDVDVGGRYNHLDVPRDTINTDSSSKPALRFCDVAIVDGVEPHT